MEKLLNLGNEYEKTLEPNLQIEWTENGVKATPLLIISNEYGFIKWLVENDKIDREKCGFKNEGLSGNWYDSGIAFVQNYDNDTFKVTEFYSPNLQLIMLLSISNSPIEDLVSYLK